MQGTSYVSQFPAFSRKCQGHPYVLKNRRKTSHIIINVTKYSVFRFIKLLYKIIYHIVNMYTIKL